MLRFADTGDGGFHFGANGGVLPLQIKYRDSGLGDALGRRITQSVVRCENPILAFGRSVTDVDGRWAGSALGHGRLPGFELGLEFLEIDATEGCGEFCQVSATLLQDGLGSDEIAGRVVVEPDGDLHHALVEGLSPAMGGAPDVFEDIVGGEVAALVDEIDAVLKFGGHGVIVA